MIVAPSIDPTFALNPIHGEMAQHRFLRAVLPHVKQFRQAVDAGAHIGLWTRMLASKFDFVIAFEPVAENFACLVQNAILRNMRLENVALGADRGTCDMEMPEGGNSGCWRASLGTGTGAEMRPLDDYNLTEVDLIKIDVEGLEGDVLVGAEKTLQRCRPTIVFEDNGLGPQYYGVMWVNPMEILTAVGYKHVGRYARNEIWAPV